MLASTFHLGHPERALKAFTQWRTSWLSREGWLSCLTLLVLAGYGAGLVFLGQRWAPLGWLGSAGSLATVFATSMIYAQLRTVPRWNSWLTPALYLALSLAGGALLAGMVALAPWLLAVAGAVLIAWWIRGDGALAGSGTTMASATGLGPIGTVRAFEPPHTGSNYLTREMIFVIGRKHAAKLRVIAFALAIALPVILLLLPFHHLLALAAVLSHLAGVATSRWLFFAQSEHVVGLYYGKR